MPPYLPTYLHTCTHLPTFPPSHIKGAGFTLLYLDDDLRMHRTFDGQYFVQQRA